MGRGIPGRMIKEMGQSFPDIQNLIQLSDIFKVSIDRLVKDHDVCNLNIFSHEQVAEQDIRMFLIRAKNSTYITSSNICLSSKPNSCDYRYSEGEYAYHCQVHGNFDCFHGEETIYCKHEKVYFCLFHGGSLS